MYTYRELVERQSGLAMLALNFSEGALAEMWFEQLGSHNNFAADIQALDSLVLPLSSLHQAIYTEQL